MYHLFAGYFTAKQQDAELNLILNNLVSSLDHAIQGDTLVSPYHKKDGSNELRQFDFVVSNPPFNMDFSDTRETIAAMPVRFWAGVPSVPAKKKESMAIYTCFIQHVVNSLKKNGKGAIVVPTGFITSKSGVQKNVLQYLVDHHIVYGVVSMPSNVFATTGTNVSVLFFDNANRIENVIENDPRHKEGKVIMIDASKLGIEYKDGNNQRRRLRDGRNGEVDEISMIVDTFRERTVSDDFSVVATYEQIIAKKYALAAGQYFDVKIEYVNMTQEEFSEKMASYKAELTRLFDESRELQSQIFEELGKVKYE